MSIKEGHKLLGYRIYRSSIKDELGVVIANEDILGENTFTYEDSDPEAGPTRYYTIVAVEDGGSGESPYGESLYGNPDTTGFNFPPYSLNPFGSPRQGYGAAPFGIEAYGS
jgi:hypothetical protein